MGKLTKEQWSELEAGYNYYNPVRLLCDGFKIELHFLIGKKTNTNMVYVNEWIKGIWIDGNHPESKFLYPKKKTIRTHTDKELRKLQRQFGKEFAEKFKPTTYTYLSFEFPSFSAFKRHLIKVCDNIEIIEK